MSNKNEVCEDFLPVRHSVVVLSPENNAGRSFKDSQIAIIKAGSQFLRADKNRRLIIEGHTFPLGNKQLEESKGQEIALFAKNFLIARGARDERIEIASRGARRPRFDPDDAQENYRLELSYLELGPVRCPELVP